MTETTESPEGVLVEERAESSRTSFVTTAASFQLVLAAAAALSDEVVIVLDAAARTVSIEAVDPAHVAMVDIEAGLVAAEGDGRFAVNAAELGPRIKDFGKKDLLRVEADHRTGKLVVAHRGIERSAALVDAATMSDPKVPKMELAARARVDAALLHRALRAASRARAWTSRFRRIFRSFSARARKGRACASCWAADRGSCRAAGGLRTLVWHTSGEMS